MTRRPLLFLQSVWTYLFIIAAFTVTIFPAAIIALPFGTVTRTRISAPFWKVFSKSLIHGAIFSSVYKRDERSEEVRKKHPEGLYISNHQSFVDVPLVLSELPIPPIMKKEILYIPVIGLCGYSAGAMIVDRKSRNSRVKVFEQAKERLTQGIKALLFYPEGTRQRGVDSPKEFKDIKKPILRFAYEQNIPVYPISIYGTTKVLRPASLMIDHRKNLGIIIRDAQKPANFEDAESFMQACWTQVQDGYSELQEKLT